MLRVDHVSGLLFDQVAGKPLVAQPVGTPDQLLVLQAGEQLQHWPALHGVVQALAQLPMQFGQVGEAFNAMRNAAQQCLACGCCRLGNGPFRCVCHQYQHAG
ncbi:hypothetical protein D3C75_952700 [compost metagenome]